MILLNRAKEELEKLQKNLEKAKRNVERIQKYNVCIGSYFYVANYSNEFIKHRINDYRINNDGQVVIVYRIDNTNYSILLSEVFLDEEEIKEKKKEILNYRLKDVEIKIKTTKEEVINKNNLLESLIFQKASIENDLLILKNGENK